MIIWLDASDAGGSTSNGDAVNLVTGSEWSNMAGSATCPMSTHEGVAVFDMESTSCYFGTEERLDYCGPSASFSTATWVDWRDLDGGTWRTLHRLTEDHIVLVSELGTELGTYSNYADGFFGSGFDISREGWQLVVSVAQDDDCTADGGVDGTTKLYVGNLTSAPTLVGTTARAAGAGGQSMYFGHPDQGPGKVAVTWAWNRDLSTSEIEQLWMQTLGYVAMPPPSSPPAHPPLFRRSTVPRSPPLFARSSMTLAPF